MLKVKGKLIVFEGTDGSGKATQAKLLFEKLQHKGFVSELVSFPRYSERLGALVGQYLAGDFGSKESLSPEFVAMLYALDRLDFKKELERKLEMGVMVVCDRFSASNFAFQGAKFEKKSEQEEFIKWIRVVESRLPKPFKTIFLDLPPVAASKLLEGADRAKSYRKGALKDVHESDLEYLNRTYQIYRRLWRSDKSWIHVESAFREKNEWVIRSKEEISVEIWRKLEPFLKK